MPIAVYFIGDASEERAARAVPAVFIDSNKDYAPLEGAIPERRVFVAIHDPWLFERVDDYMCRRGLYDKGAVTVLNEGDGIQLGEFSDTIAFLTDDLEFAHDLKRQETSQ